MQGQDHIPEEIEAGDQNGQNGNNKQDIAYDPQIMPPQRHEKEQGDDQAARYHTHDHGSDRYPEKPAAPVKDPDLIFLLVFPVPSSLSQFPDQLPGTVNRPAKAVGDGQQEESYPGDKGDRGNAGLQELYEKLGIVHESARLEN
jgi:hypothetical protein